MKGPIKIFKNENGQALVLAAIAMVVLMGFAAFALDMGTMYVARSDLQNAADAAALAGAADLPDAADAESTAIYYAEQNGLTESEIEVNTSYDGDSNQIEVICTKTVSYSFARVLGFTDMEVSARAVAQMESQWAGETLPFINLDDDYTDDSEIVAWEKTGPGDFESIDNYEIINPGNPNTLYFMVDYINGIEVKKGTVATIKQEVGYVYNQHLPDKPIYLLSLKKSVIYSGKVLLTNGSYSSLSKMKNNDIIDPSQLILLECIFHDYDYKGKTLYFTVLEDYDIMSGEFPPDYEPPDSSGGTLFLVE
jgi:hypothetical protein